VWRTGLSGGAPDSVRCTRGPRAELLSLGNFQKPAHYNSSDCPVYTGQCPVLQEDAARNLAASGNHNGCSAIIHRTCLVYTGLSGATAGQRLLRANGRLQQQLMRARARSRQARPYWRTGHSTVHVWCATGHQGGPKRQNSNG
jgi:hypothetical protein